MNTNITRLLKIILTISVLSHSSCDNMNKKAPPEDLVVYQSDLFLDLFSEIEVQDLHIYTPSEAYESSNIVDKYEGKQIDRSFYKFLAFDNYNDPTQIDTFFIILPATSSN